MDDSTKPGADLGAKVRSLRLPSEPEATAGGSALPWVMCAVFACTSLVFGYMAFIAKPKTVVTPPVASTPTKSTTTASANSALPGTTQVVRDDALALESKGYIIPAHQILVSPKVSGMVTDLYVEEGKRVEKGQVLAIIESTDYQADFNRHKATLDLAKVRLLELQNGNRPEEVGQAKADLAESQAQLVQLKADWERYGNLRRKGVSTDEQYDSAESKYRAMQKRVERLDFTLKLMEQGARNERLEMAKAEVMQAEADLSKSKWRLDNCTIKAPISGTILKKNAEEGNIVNPVAFNGSFSLCDMADLSDLEVDLNIQERDVSRVFAGQRCKVRAEAYPNRVYEGVVSRLMPIADRAKGAIPVRVKVTVPSDEEGVYLKPEMGVLVSFFGSEPKKAEPDKTAEK